LLIDDSESDGDNIAEDLYMLGRRRETITEIIAAEKTK
tara:strand:+ start:426 stop:539 length:114 start_codon:yes stop_codon:yes gene_type:complete